MSFRTCSGSWRVAVHSSPRALRGPFLQTITARGARKPSPVGEAPSRALTHHGFLPAPLHIPWWPRVLAGDPGRMPGGPSAQNGIEAVESSRVWFSYLLSADH